MTRLAQTTLGPTIQEWCVGVLVQIAKTNPSELRVYIEKILNCESGKVVKREGAWRVQVAFSSSHGRPYKKWLSQHKLEKAPAAPVYAKCPYPPQSLEAKLWYKEHKRVG